MRQRTILAAATLGVAAIALTGCVSDADRVSENLSKGAEQFEFERRVIFYNGITNEYLLTIEGRCSVEPIEGRLEVICKTGEDAYKKHFLGLSDNVTWFAEQTEEVDADEYRYRVILKPETVIPDFDVETSTDIEGDG